MPLRVPTGLVKHLYPRWPRADAARPGYSLLLALPPDLPLFLQLALRVCRDQDATHLNETLIVPDHHRPEFARSVHEEAEEWPGANIHLVEPDLRARLVRRRIRQGSLIHWLQVHQGTAAACSSHVLLHDADFFSTERTMHRDLYRMASERDLACAGTSRPRRGVGYPEHPDLDHVVGGWQLIYSRQWARSRPPHFLMPCTHRVGGLAIKVDTTVHAQATTPPHRVGRYEPAPGSVFHLYGVITTYRRYQRSSPTFEDDRFHVLFIRLLADGLRLRDPPDLPALDQLVRGIDDGDQRVHYTHAARTAYPAFRAEIEPLLTRGFIPPPAARHIADVLERFDHAFATTDAGTR